MDSERIKTSAREYLARDFPSERAAKIFRRIILKTAYAYRVASPAGVGRRDAPLFARAWANDNSRGGNALR